MAIFLTNDGTRDKANGFGRDSTSTQNKTAQSIQESTAINGLKRLFVRLSKTGTPTDNAVIEIQTDNSGAPSGSVLATGSIANTGIGNYAFCLITLDSSINLTANTKYWIVFSRSGSTSDSNYYQAGGTAANSYANGVARYLNNGTWADSTGDCTDINFILCNGSTNEDLLLALVSYWKLNESSGNATDSHGVNTLTNNGTMTYSAGKIKNGAVTASGKYLSIADASQTGLDITSDFSISCWVKPTTDIDSGIQYWIASKYVADARSFLFMYQNSGGTKQLFLAVSATGDGTSDSMTKNVDLGTNTFKHVVMSWKASTSTATFYVNGSSLGTSTGTSTSMANTGSPFAIGSATHVGGLEFLGMIDEVGIWARELTSTEVTTLYNGGIGLPYPLTLTTGGAFLFNFI